MNHRPAVDLALLTLCFMSLFCLGLIDNSRASAYPQLLNDLNVTNSQGALFFAITSGFQLVSTFAARWWLPRWHPLGGLRRFLFLLALACALVGAGSYAPASIKWPAVLFAAVLLGLAFGGVGICQNALVAEAASPAYQRRAYGVLHMMYGLSSFAAPFYVTLGGQWGLTWGQCFLVAALLPAVLGVRALLVKPAVSRQVEKKIEAAMTNHSHSYDYRQWLIAVLLGVYVIAEVAISSRLVLYGVSELGLSQSNARHYLSLFFLGLLCGRMIMGVYPLSVRSSQLLLGSAAISLAGYTLGLLYWPILLPLCGMLMSPFFPTAMAWMTEHLSTKVPSTTSLIMFLQGLMLMGMHQTMGILEQMHSVKVALWIGPCALGVTLVGIYLLQRVEKPV